MNRTGAGCDRRERRPHRSEEHTSELQSLAYLVCRLLLEKKKKRQYRQQGPPVCSRQPTGTLAERRRECCVAPSALCFDNIYFSHFVVSRSVFFFMDGAPPEISTFPLRDAFPI